jgi:hypothetical protein
MERESVNHKKEKYINFQNVIKDTAAEAIQRALTLAPERNTDWDNARVVYSEELRDDTDSTAYIVRLSRDSSTRQNSDSSYDKSDSFEDAPTLADHFEE